MLRSASLVGVLVAMLAACGGATSRGPAWPQLHAREADGGESLAPRQASSVAAIEEAVDVTSSAAAPAAPAAAAPASPSSARPDRPADAPPPREPDILTTEDIIIEIDD